MLRVGTSLLLLAFSTPATAAQGVLESFSYEGLRFAGVGFEVGAVVADRLESDVAGGVRIDAGYFAPSIRPLVGLTVFRSRYTTERITEFEQQLRGVVVDPTGDFTIAVGEVTLTDIAVEVDLQYVPMADRALSPYAGLGLGVHLRDANGVAIAGTFVEDALQTIAATLNASAGFEVRVTRGLRLAVDARGMLGSGLLAATVRGGLWIRLPEGAS